MTAKQDMLWDRLLSLLLENLIDRDTMLQLRARIDWDKAVASYLLPGFDYPDYYRTQNFHGIEGGYLTISAAVTSDPTSY